MASNNYNNSFNDLSTQQQKLAFFENQIISDYIAPYRNKHIIPIFLRKEDQQFYFSDQYTYGNNSIGMIQQVVIVKEGAIDDTYAIFELSEEDNKILTISYESLKDSSVNKYTTYSSDNNILSVSYEERN